MKSLDMQFIPHEPIQPTTDPKPSELDLLRNS